MCVCVCEDNKKCTTLGMISDGGPNKHNNWYFTFQGRNIWLGTLQEQCPTESLDWLRQDTYR